MNFRPAIRLSPLTHKRVQNFLHIRRARISLVLLVVLFGISLVSELICNSRPLFLRVNGKSFFPFVQNLTQRDLLGPGADGTRVNYHAFTASPAFIANARNRVVWPLVAYSPGDVSMPPPCATAARSKSRSSRKHTSDASTCCRTVRLSCP